MVKRQAAYGHKRLEHVYTDSAGWSLGSRIRRMYTMGNLCCAHLSKELYRSGVIAPVATTRFAVCSAIPTKGTSMGTSVATSHPPPTHFRVLFVGNLFGLRPSQLCGRG